MVSYAKSYSLNDIEDLSDLVVEGEVGFVYKSIVPGISPRQIGHHVLFKAGTQKIVKSQRGSDIVVKLFPDVGFWTLDDCCDQLKVGDQIRVSLVRDQNSRMALVLMPFPANNSIYDLRKNECLSFRVTPTLCKLSTSSLVVGTTVFPPELGGNEIFNWNGAIQAAATLWNNLGSQMKVVLVGETGSPFPINIIPIFVDSISPSAPNRPEPLMRVVWPPCQSNTQNPNLLVNSNPQVVVWSQAPTPPPGTFDFRTVMAHELGHAMGLAHNPTDRTSLMWDTFNAQEVRVPNNEDRDALIGLYG